MGGQISRRRALIASGRMSERHRLSRETGVRGTPLLCFGLACHGTLVDGSRADREPGDERHHPVWGALSESSNCSNVPLARIQQTPCSAASVRTPRTAQDTWGSGTPAGRPATEPLYGASLTRAELGELSVASGAASSQRRRRRPDVLFRALLWVGAPGVAAIKRVPFVCDGRARVRSGCRRDGS